jgi:hypothetical protein
VRKRIGIALENVDLAQVDAEELRQKLAEDDATERARLLKRDGIERGGVGSEQRAGLSALQKPQRSCPGLPIMALAHKSIIIGRCIDCQKTMVGIRAVS